jgi:tRNA A37 threonylcarbamoyladenosine dehydratase
VYKLMPVSFNQKFYDERTNRNIGWITYGEQQQFRHTVVGIAGCGGMGGLVAATLVRLGIGEIRIADTETFDVSNLNRQFAASLRTLGLSKAFATAAMMRDIANDTTIVVYPQGITEETVEDFVRGCDIICDEIEFWAIASRILLHLHMRREYSTLLCTPTVGHRAYVTKYTADSLFIEDLLGVDYVAAKKLQAALQSNTASSDDVVFVMEAMLRFAAPELPEYSADLTIYSTVQALRDRLQKETRASIIATNPPMASGFLANQVLFHLLQTSPIPRNFVLVPVMPGYLMFDAGLLETKIEYAQWW